MLQVLFETNILPIANEETMDMVNSAQTNLLSINNYHYKRAGAEVVYFFHNELYSKHGWEVAHFAMQHPGNDESPWSEYFPPMIELSEMHSLFDKLIRAPQIIYNTSARSCLNKLLDDFNPDIAHAHNIYHHLSPSILSLLKQRKIPTVMTLHDLKLACPAYKMLNKNGICEECKSGSYLPIIKNRCIKNSLPISLLIWLESTIHRIFSLYAYVDKFIVPSNFYREKLIEWGLPEEKFEVVYNPIDVNKYTPDYKPGTYFLYFGRLSEEKGLKTLIHAAAKSKVSLKIAGSGELEQELKKLVSELSADVSFLGFIGGDELTQTIRASRAIVLPSEWYENAPMSLLESNALGKPVIGANIGGIPEFIRHGETGYIYSGNSDELANVLMNVGAKSATEIEEAGRNARNYVSLHHSPERYFSEMNQIYSQLGLDI